MTQTKKPPDSQQYSCSWCLAFIAFTLSLWTRTSWISCILSSYVMTDCTTYSTVYVALSDCLPVLTFTCLAIMKSLQRNV
jgi:hypothetical protein